MGLIYAGLLWFGILVLLPVSGDNSITLSNYSVLSVGDRRGSVNLHSNRVSNKTISTLTSQAITVFKGERNEPQVTWIRHKDVQVLTAGVFTYTTDPRINTIHSEGSHHWTLRLTQTKVSDSGTYECQVSTEPKISQNFTLLVVDASAKISGPKAVHMISGSNINLTCTVMGTNEGPSPQYIYWYHGNILINYSSRGGISVVTNKLSRTSRLLITRATVADSGNYTCTPANSQSASVSVYILNGEHPAAVQGAENVHVFCHSLLFILLFVSVFNTFIHR